MKDSQYLSASVVGMLDIGFYLLIEVTSKLLR